MQSSYLKKNKKCVDGQYQQHYQHYPHINNDNYRHHSWLSSTPSFTVIPLTEGNLTDLQTINQHVLPVQYTNPRLFTQMITSGRKLSCIVYNNKNGQAVGCMGCRLEKLSVDSNEGTTTGTTTSTSNDMEKTTATTTARIVHNHHHHHHHHVRIYLMTLAVLAPYRNMGIGHLMMQYLLSGVDRIENNIQSTRIHIDSIYLHVQQGNAGALRFYERYGFREREYIENYYKKITPSGAHVLQLTLR